MKQLPLIEKRKRTRGVKLGRPVSTFTGARQRREVFLARHPLHVTIRLRDGLPNMRTRRGAQIIKNAIVGAQNCGVRILHFALLSNHIHLIIEPRGAEIFFNAMKSLTSRLGIHIRRWAATRVTKKLDALGFGLFRGRYDVQVIKTPQQMKHALKYVLLNPAKHFKKAPYLDMFTSGVVFTNWKKLIGYELPATSKFKLLENKLRDFLASPTLWLSDVGWMKAKV